jgi:hypothetical protein
MLLSNNLKAKGSETKCTKNEKNSARGNERKYILSSYRVEVGGTCCFGGTCFGWQLLGHPINWKPNRLSPYETKMITSFCN